MLLAIELTVLCQMCDPHFKFEEDRTETSVAIQSNRYFGGTDGRTDRQSDKQSIDFISVQCHELHWTDNNNGLLHVAAKYGLIQ